MNPIRKKLFSILPIAVTVCTLSTSVLAGDPAAGKALYDGAGACGTCHGAAGAGDGAAAAALNPKPASFVTGAFRLDTDGDGKPGSDVDIANSIKNGAAMYNGNPAMPGRADLSDTQINDLVAYLHSLKK